MNTSRFASFSILILLSTNASLLAQTSRPEPVRPPSTADRQPATSTPRPTGTTGTASPAPASPTTTTTSIRSANGVVSADYRLVPGDKLRVDVYRDPNLSQSLQVRPDGKITLPLLGDIVASGRTPSELRDSIAESLKQYITEPVVTVIVVESVPPTFYVMGEVNNPGPQALVGHVTVLQALATAGGFRDFAKTKDIRILRKNATGVETIRFNYKDAVRGIGSTVFVQAGDTIIVP